MQLHDANDGIQCNGCLALMSLVRGEGDVCQTNQWAIAKAGSVEVIAAAMRAFRGSAMVQLSALLAMIPLALENAMMQAHLTQVGPGLGGEGGGGGQGGAGGWVQAACQSPASGRGVAADAPRRPVARPAPGVPG
jgi:hypothetical protein